MHATAKAAPDFIRLGIEHAGAIADLEALCFSLPWSASQCLAALRQKNFAAFGLWQKGCLVGYVSLYHFEGEMEIINLAVHPLARRLGHARRMLNLLLQVARKMDILKIVLEVRESNMAAIALYEQTGFIVSGLRKNYYPDTGENALLYRHELLNPENSFKAKD